MYKELGHTGTSNGDAPQEEWADLEPQNWHAHNGIYPRITKTSYYDACGFPRYQFKCSSKKTSVAFKG